MAVRRVASKCVRHLLVSCLREPLQSVLHADKKVVGLAHLLFGDVVQDFRPDRVAKRRQIGDHLAPQVGQIQTLRPAIARVAPALDEVLLNETIQKANEGNRLQLEVRGQFGLSDPLFPPQATEHGPLGPRRSIAAGAIIDIGVQEPRGLDQMKDEIAAKLESVCVISHSEHIVSLHMICRLMDDI